LHILTDRFNGSGIEPPGLKRFESLKLRAGYYKRNGHKFARFELIEKIAELKEKIKEYEQG